MKACGTWAVLAFAVVELACSASRPTEQSRMGVTGDGAQAGSLAAASGADASQPAAPSNPTSPVLKTPETAPTVGADGGMAADECGRQRFDVQRKPADVLLVLDRSGSMKEEPDGADDDAPSKWELVVPAIKEAISATDGALSWGLKLFPEGDDAGECSVKSYPGSIAVPIAPMNASKVNQAIDATMPKGDGTPTGDAMTEAVKYLQQLDDKNTKLILLATDGEPSCAGKEKGGDDARAAARTAVESAANSGFDTFVVGISTTKKSASMTLTELAAAGKRAPASGYYLANTQDELVAALETITSAAASCRFPLGAKPPVPDHVGVSIGPDRVAKDTGHKDGWDYVDAEYSAVELFGPACDTVKANGADAVSVVFGCKSDELF